MHTHHRTFTCPDCGKTIQHDYYGSEQKKVSEKFNMSNLEQLELNKQFLQAIKAQQEQIETLYQMVNSILNEPEERIPDRDEQCKRILENGFEAYYTEPDLVEMLDTIADFVRKNPHKVILQSTCDAITQLYNSIITPSGE